ncbi:MAG: hypothetical protein IPG51_18340 [Chloroflexi bacterium]|nr:hypothetical protein [Chloroflexota bacterium]
MAVHEHLIGQSQLDLQQVQADEIKAKILGGSLWLAMAIMVSTRLWLVVLPVHTVTWNSFKVWLTVFAPWLFVALCYWPSMVYLVTRKHFNELFRSKGSSFRQKGRPQLYAWPDIAIVQVDQTTIACWIGN